MNDDSRPIDYETQFESREIKGKNMLCLPEENVIELFKKLHTCQGQ